MAHARRYFVDATRLTRNKKGIAHYVINQMAKLYKIEKDLKEENYSIEKIIQKRTEDAKLILDDIKRVY